MRFSNRVAVLAIILSLLGSVIGCKNTADGFGKDVEKTGEKIQEKVD